MLDQAKSGAIPRRMLAGDLPQPPEADPRPLPEDRRRSPTPSTASASPRVLAACAPPAASRRPGSGPVGYIDHEPICDLCLLERSTDLGLMLATIAVVRTYAATGGTAEERQDAVHELGVFTRIYHRVASKSWSSGFQVSQAETIPRTEPATDRRIACRAL